jgi:uncharacterized protein YoxC
MIILLKKYWKYIAAVVVGALSIVLFILLFGFLRKNGGNTDKGAKTLGTIVKDVSSKMTEATQMADVEAVVAKTKDEGVKEELKEIQKTKDPAERRKQLVFLHSRVRKS